MTQFCSQYVIDKYFNIDFIEGNEPNCEEMIETSREMEKKLPKKSISNGCIWNIDFDDLDGYYALRFNSPNMAKWLYRSRDYNIVLQLLDNFTKEGVSCDFDSFFEIAAEIKQEMDRMRSK